MIVILTYKRSIHAFNREAHCGRRRPVAYHAAAVWVQPAVAAVTSGLVAKTLFLITETVTKTLWALSRM